MSSCRPLARMMMSKNIQKFMDMQYKALFNHDNIFEQLIHRVYPKKSGGTA